MDGISFLADLIATGRLHGIGPGASMREVDQAVKAEFIEVVDEGHQTLRRDYGFVELYFSGRPGPEEWVMTSGVIEVHRLADDSEGMAEEWRRDMGVDFPAYCSWAELREALSRTPGAPEFERIQQDGYLEFLVRETNTSVIVVDDREECDHRPGKGDVWSVGFSLKR
ncbi:hypothetical protein ABZ370_07720 [Streptomyces sp. NPDC005962]|uniref:hypothetical protein n=1 Tax=Streptomyces sp. NPDC005962 TaxID=3154466 RepID=UPI0033DAAD13